MRGSHLVVGGGEGEVDDGVGAEVVQVVGQVGGSGGQHPDAGLGGELDGRLADAAAGAVDQQRVPGAQARGLDGLVGGDTGGG
nr:hypothetical protein [Saccharothrix deserti]